MPDKQMGLFEGPPPSHLQAGESLKDRGLDAVEANNEGWMHRARLQARLIYRDTRGVCSDDLRRWADRTGDQPNSPNAWGAVFKGNEWRCIGRCKSTYTPNHGREIRVWAPEGTGWNGLV